MRKSLMLFYCLVLASTATFAADAAPSPKVDAFSISLFAQLENQSGNLISSPLSARTAMAMAAVGAQGKTARQINSLLGDPIAQPLTNLSQIKLANGLWGQQGFTLNETYRTSIRDQFAGDCEAVDFKSDPSAAAKQINQWVATKTADKISTLFAAGSLKNTDRLVIVNAIYLKADWAKPFEKDATRDGPFTLDSAKASVNVPTMHGRVSGRYFANDDLEMISLPYKGDDLSMTILLPRKPGGLLELEKNLTAATLGDWLRQEEQNKLELSLPKWKSSSSLELVPAFQALGVRAAFTDVADFSGISSTTRLQIGQIVQKAVIDVDESGTEAAAATGIEMRTMSAAPRKAITVNVDHPFLYFLQAHAHSGNEKAGSDTLLFMGRMIDPRSS